MMRWVVRRCDGGGGQRVGEKDQTVWRCMEMKRREMKGRELQTTNNSFSSFYGELTVPNELLTFQPQRRNLALIDVS